MSYRFVCFVKHRQNRFNIVVTQDAVPTTAPFADIFSKIRQIFSIAYNRDIGSQSYIFELIDSKTGESSIIREFGQPIRHLSVITMRDKPSALRIGRIRHSDPDVHILTLTESVNEIHVMKLMIEAIDKEDFRERPAETWKRLYQRLLKQFPSTFRTYTPITCHELLNRWTRFYATTYDRINHRLESWLQRRFDMLKVVHRIDPSKLFSSDAARMITIIGQQQEIQDYLYFYNTYGIDIYQSQRSVSVMPLN